MQVVFNIKWIIAIGCQVSVRFAAVGKKHWPHQGDKLTFAGRIFYKQKQNSKLVQFNCLLVTSCPVYFFLCCVCFLHQILILPLNFILSTVSASFQHILLKICCGSIFIFKYVYYIRIIKTTKFVVIFKSVYFPHSCTQHYHCFCI